ncbi:MAG: CehA/McbA family metallohydrolase [Syntrophomonadaceae bacterium]|nr:CehA/McbA family metallohydrolase [Syntrophomonadaceae bacterium]
MFEYTGNMHIHSRYSDGSATISQIRNYAKQAGLDFIIVTDHFNMKAASQEGYKDGLLMLVGMEINEAHNHYLALDIDQVVKNNTEHPQEVIDAVNQQEGIGIIAHPLEYASNFLNEGNVYNWVDWSVEGFQGIEIWNLLSQWKGSISNFYKALYYILNPQGALIGPYPQTMRRFDDYQRQGKRIVACGGADAHAPGLRLGPFYFKIISYPFSFRSINMHTLLPQPLSGNLATDKKMIYDALRNASCWVANDYFKNSRGFSFTLCDDRQIWNMGEDVPWQENLQCKVSTPYRARVKLYKNGELAAESEGREHLFQGITRGIYRVEAYLRYRCKYRPWIFTNSIWVN